MKKIVNYIIILILIVSLMACKKNNNTKPTNTNNDNSDEIKLIENKINKLTTDYDIMVRTRKTNHENDVKDIQNQMKNYQNIMFIGDLSNYQIELNRLNQEEEQAKIDFGKTKNVYEYDAKIKSINRQKDDLKKLYDNRLKYDELNKQITKLTNDYNDLITRLTSSYNNDLSNLKNQLNSLKSK